MALPFLPLYVTDYLADTFHLTPTQHGVYLRVLMECWLTPGCSIPDDPKWLAARLGLDVQDYDSVILPVLEQYLKRSRKRWYSPRLRAAYNDAMSTHQLRVSAGRKGGNARKSLKSNDQEASRAKAGLKQPEPEPELELDSGGGGGGTPRAPLKVVELKRDLRWRLVEAAGLDPRQQGRLGDLKDMRHVEEAWLSTGLSEDRIVQIVRDASKPQKPSRLSYFDKAIARALAQDQAPPEAPIRPEDPPRNPGPSAPTAGGRQRPQFQATDMDELRRNSQARRAKQGPTE